jgi:hypothetical protein
MLCFKTKFSLHHFMFKSFQNIISRKIAALRLKKSVALMSPLPISYAAQQTSPPKAKKNQQLFANFYCLKETIALYHCACEKRGKKHCHITNVQKIQIKTEQI